jgi:hypothetical protein
MAWMNFVNPILELFGISLTCLIITSVLTGEDIFVQTVWAHVFSTTDESILVTLVEQIKAETQLVITKSISNDNNSIHDHASYAAQLEKALDDNLTQSTPLLNIAQVYDDGQRNSTTLALVFANLLDDILTKYGSAVGVKYDMTNMSNMRVVSVPRMDDTTSHSMGAALTVDQYNEYILGEQSSGTAWNTSKVVKLDKYETAQVLSENIIEKFDNQLRPRTLVNETANVDRLEYSLKELKYSVDKKVLPEVVMEIIHIQIHPLLQEIYNLQVL